MTTKSRSRLIQIVFSIAILVAAIYLANQILSNPPEAKKKRAPKRPVVTVKTQTMIPEQYRMQVRSYGKLQAKTRGSLAAQINGVITELGPHVQPGLFFQKGELLFRIDDRDYQTALQIAESELAQAKAKLVEEKAKSEQAKRNWERLKAGEKPNELVLRKPYLASVEAAIMGAEALRDQAALNLERTRIVAPYDGRILQKHVDIGQFVSKGNPLAEIFATDALELRMPLTSSQQKLIHLPELSKDKMEETELPLVDIENNGTGKKQWKGRLTRVEGAVDLSSQQLFVVAEINTPYRDLEAGESPLRIGQFVQAVIHGKRFNKVYRIPSHALYTGDEILLYKDQLLERRPVTVLNRSEDFAVLSGGVQANELLVITPLGNVVTGTKARLFQKSRGKK